MKNRTVVLILLIITAIMTRFIPHLPNFTAVGAVALFSGAVFKKKSIAFMAPFAIMFLSDLLINNVILASYYSGFQWLTPGWFGIYLSFFVTVLLGMLIHSYKVLPIATGAVVSAAVFFLITNFGSWMGNPLYSKDVTGLMAAYTAGIPFFANQLLGNLFYSALLFGMAWLLVDRTALKPLKVKH